MKKLILIFSLLIAFTVTAQEKDSLSQAEKERREKNIQAGNPFKKYGYTPKIATLSKGKYLEWHDLDSIVIIGSVYFNTKSKKIIDFVERDMTNPDAQPLSDIRGRWISPDPLAEEFPDWSPYNFVYNNPLRFTDPTGMAPEDIYKLNADGTLTWMSESNTDVVHAAKDFNSDGTVQTGAKGVEVGEKGFIANNSGSVSVNAGGNDYTVNYINFGSDTGKAKEVFKFFADNADVEFNREIISQNGENPLNLVGTLNHPTRTLTFGLAGYNQLDEYDHSHPAGSDYSPSGYNLSFDKKGNFILTPGLGVGDRKVALDFPNTRFGLYLPATNSTGAIPKMDTNVYLRYNKDGAISTQYNVKSIP